jgi:hypothetical protein
VIGETHLSTVPYEAKKVGTHERLEKITIQRKQVREQKARKQFRRLPLFNFETYETLRSDLTHVQQITKEHLKAKLVRLNLPTNAVDDLQVQFIAPIPEDKDGLQTTGYMEYDSGLIAVAVDPQNPLETGLTLAHEFSHGASGVIEEFTDNGMFALHRRRFIAGFHHYDVATRQNEGDLLDNALATWDAAEVYTLLKESGLFGHGTSLRDWSFRHREPDPAKAYIQRLNEDIVLAKKHAIPEALIEPYVFSAARLEQMILVWRVAKILGESIRPPSEQADEISIVQRGRDLLERSRFTGIREAHEKIKEVFGDDAPLILLPEDHPKNLQPVVKAVERAEERIQVIKKTLVTDGTR